MLTQGSSRKLWLVKKKRKKDAFIFFPIRLSVIGVEKRTLRVVPFKTEQRVAYIIRGILEFEN